MSKNTISPVVAVVGAALAGSLSAAELPTVEGNPFAAAELDRGYQQIAGAEGTCGGEGNCGEGKCGGDKDDDGDAT